MKTEEKEYFLKTCNQEIGRKHSVSDNIKWKEKREKQISFLFQDYQKIVFQAKEIKKEVLDHLDAYLLAFESMFNTEKRHVKWCIDYNDLLSETSKIVFSKKQKSIFLMGQEMMEETGIMDYFIENEVKINTDDSDIAIAEIPFFTAKEGLIYFRTDSKKQFDRFLQAKTKILLCSIAHVLPNIESLTTFSHLYAIHKDNILNYPYELLLSMADQNQNEDIHIILLDNGRSKLIENDKIREALACIHCESCKKHCPIFQIIGEKPYDNVFSGPISQVVLPYLEAPETVRHLSFNSTLCGACSAGCPMGIPLEELMIFNRGYFYDNGLMGYYGKKHVKKFFKMLKRDRIGEKPRFLKKHILKNFLEETKLPKNISSFSKKSFRKQYSKQKNKQ